MDTLQASVAANTPLWFAPSTQGDQHWISSFCPLCTLKQWFWRTVSAYARPSSWTCICLFGPRPLSGTVEVISPLTRCFMLCCAPCLVTGIPLGNLFFLVRFRGPNFHPQSHSPYLEDSSLIILYMEAISPQLSIISVVLTFSAVSF